MTRLERAKLISDIAAVWFGLIALVVGGGFGLVQYFEKVSADRVRLTLDFLDRQSRPPVAEARRNVNVGWRDTEAEMEQILNATDSPEVEFSNYVLQKIEAKRLAIDVDQMLDFYETLQICVANALCDKKAAYALFKGEARAFYRLHFPYIQRQKDWRHDASFATNLQAFAELD